MAYSDDSVKTKLSSLNETQDSIVAVAQWIMFHRRHADRTAQIWLQRLDDATTLKRLNLIYLANEVVQQSRARSKTDFLHAFEPLISDATATAYKGASMEVQNKLKRVVEVWRQRNIFDQNIQTNIEQKIGEIDRSRGGSNGLGGKGKLGGSLFGGSLPAELEDLSKHFTTLSKAEMSSKTSVPAAEVEFEKLMNSQSATPTPPVHAARLASLLKSLASAKNAVEGCIKTRQDIITGLEKLLQTHKVKLIEEQIQDEANKSKMTSVENRKKEVEDQIMQGLTSLDTATIAVVNEKLDITRPEPESFTPPPPDVEAFTPPPQDEPLIGDAVDAETLLSGPTGAESIAEQPIDFNEPPPTSMPTGRQPYRDSSEDPRLKRRKMSHATDVEDEIFGASSMGVDEEGISAILGN